MSRRIRQITSQLTRCVLAAELADSLSRAILTSQLIGAELDESVRHAWQVRFAPDLALEFRREHNTQKQKTKKPCLNLSISIKIPTAVSHNMQKTGEEDK